MKRLYSILLVVMSITCLGALPPGVTGKKIFEYPNNPSPGQTYLFLIDPGTGAYENTTIGQMAIIVNSLSTSNGVYTNIIVYSNAYIFSITNELLVSSNAYITNLTVENITVNSNAFITNLTVENITNNTFISTNTLITTNNTFLSFTTNLFSTNIFTTNLFATTITNNTFVSSNAYITNLMVVFPGGATNLNLTPNTVMYSDANDAESSIPNATGILTNNGTGAIGWASTISFDEIDANLAYLTNLFTLYTNASYLMTDGDGKLIPGTGTNIIQTITNNLFVSTNIIVYDSITVQSNLTVLNNTYISTNFSTNLYYVTGKGNTMIITNVYIASGGSLVNTNATASTVAVWDSNKFLTNAVNALGVLTNSASGPPSFGLLANSDMQNSSITIQGAAVSLGGSTLSATASPSFLGYNMTNFNGMVPTNSAGGSAMVTGGLGTTETLYTTNITANTTLAAPTITTAYQASGIKLYCTCSGGTDRTLTFANGFVGAGSLAGYAKPPVVTVTNGGGAYFDMIIIPGVASNVFWAPF